METDYLKDVERKKSRIAENDKIIRFLKSIEYCKKADGSEYQQKYRQSKVIKHNKTSWSNYYYFEIPDLRNFRVEMDNGKSFREDIEELIAKHEHENECLKIGIQRALALDPYYKQFKAIQAAYMQLIEDARKLIENQLANEFPEFAFAGIGEDKHSVVQFW